MPDRIVIATEDRRRAVLEVIAGARQRLSLSLFRCNDAEVFGALADAVSRGVAVEVLTTTRAKGGRKRLEDLRAALLETGATVHAYADPVVKYHAKYVVADDGPAIVASLNFTRKCFARTCDALVVTDDPAVVAGLRQLFEADRDHRPLPDALTPRLVVGPELARRQLTDLVAGASSSIRLIDAKLSDPDLVALLNARRRDGLRVEAFTAKRVGGLKSHGKILLVDDRVAVVGGLAMSALSLEFRREVAILVDAPAAVADLGRLFDTVATNGDAQPEGAAADGVPGRAAR